MATSNKSRMAWRRGFFRLWVGLSMIWVAFVAFVHFSEWTGQRSYGIEIRLDAGRDPTGDPELIGQLQEARALVERIQSVRALAGLLLVDYMTLHDRLAAEPDGVSFLDVKLTTRHERIGPFGPWPDFVMLNETTGFSPDTVRKMSDALLARGWRHQLPAALALLFLPPLILFALGIGVTWILQGFRRVDPA